MKKAIVITALMLTCLTVFESCKKSEETAVAATQTTVSFALKPNQSYTYTLPVTDGKQTYRIVQASLNNATTALTVDASGNMQLVYTPALNYVGTDLVTLSNAPADTCKGKRPPHHQGNKERDALKLRLPHKHHKKSRPAENMILINFNISSDETITTVN